MVFQMTLSGKILSGTVKGPVEFMLYISGVSLYPLPSARVE